METEVAKKIGRSTSQAYNAPWRTVRLRKNQHTKQDKQEVAEVGSQVGRCLELDQQREARAPDFRENFFARLDGSFRPTMLLRLKAVHIDRKFGGHDHIGEVNELPAFQLCTVAEIEILGERVMLPASGIGNARLSPDACGSIEIEKPPAAAAGGLFEEKMTIQEEGLNLRQ